MKLVPPSEIEGIVGAKRHPTAHIGRAVSKQQTFYILHSAECVALGVDLSECPYSVALDEYGIDVEDEWLGLEDRAVALDIDEGALVPSTLEAPDA